MFHDMVMTYNFMRLQSTFERKKFFSFHICFSERIYLGEVEQGRENVTSITLISEPTKTLKMGHPV